MVLSGANGALSSEAMGQLRPLPGASAVSVLAGQGGTAVLTFASLAPRAKGATLDFSGPSLGSVNRVLLSGQSAGPIGGPMFPAAPVRSVAPDDTWTAISPLPNGAQTTLRSTRFDAYYSLIRPIANGDCSRFTTTAYSPKRN